jgi:osmoprotectant transport system substrate-binding protein
MGNTATRPEGAAGRRRRCSLLAVVAAAALVLAACGVGGGQGAPSGPGVPFVPVNSGGSQEGPPPDALAMTATPGKFQLPQGTPGVGKAQVVLGSKDFAEQDLLNDVYTQALRAKGYTIISKLRIGSSEVIDQAFASDLIQMYPEYLGEIATGTTMAALRTPPLNASSTYRAAQQFEQSQRAGQLFQQTPYQNVDTIVVKPDFAQRYGLKTVADLNNVGPGGQGVKIAAQAPFRTRFSGLVGLGSQYGLTQLESGFVPVPAGEGVYRALDDGQVNAADAFSTDPQLLGNQYVPLRDPRNIFGSQFVAPVVKQATAQQEGPEFEQTCDWVSGLLTVRAIQQMNQAVANGQNPVNAAGTFLQQSGLR